ncbi:hypothetical protein RO3G_17120 [Rhizopus delemar RA 99-880]|uniref:Uncharacterized protein n=1 Tax=Rhizopus delemar (strain RA 99-880 / ATCC MYA-4621 / FGSC 9543 / NRRL 43880) TaxID=246409 RepID=I1CVP2_RHIO9|nr:hypothetical protein RO3G_17120 [Rhizopus delemar RA 99-880]|eukprot:EIE92522.1 hypothetical protein RO3G_17120 [Rhizopus delemar RA 99-880]
MDGLDKCNSLYRKQAPSDHKELEAANQYS